MLCLIKPEKKNYRCHPWMALNDIISVDRWQHSSLRWSIIKFNFNFAYKSKDTNLTNNALNPQGHLQLHPMEPLGPPGTPLRPIWTPHASEISPETPKTPSTQETFRYPLKPSRKPLKRSWDLLELPGTIWDPWSAPMIIGCARNPLRSPRTPFKPLSTP